MRTYKYKKKAKRKGWGYYFIYCPKDCIKKIKDTFHKFKRENAGMWFNYELEKD